jgi:hypothetical protein
MLILLNYPYFFKGFQEQELPEILFPVVIAVKAETRFSKKWMPSGVPGMTELKQ